MTAELLEQIRAAPDDDAPRLVYADYLVERGDPRGELIHLQCAGKPCDELRTRLENAWRDRTGLDVRFTRGFVSTVGGPVEWIVKHRDVFASELVTTVELEPMDLRPIAALHELRAIQTIVIRDGDLLEDDAAQLATCIHLAPRKLELRSRIDIDSARVLGACLWYRALSTLALRYVSDRVLVHLIGHGGQLAALELRECQPFTDTALEIARALRSLERLSFVDTWTLGLPGAQILARAELPRLVELEAIRALGDGPLRTLVNASWPLQRLRVLHSQVFDPNAIGTAAFANSLVDLSLFDNFIRDVRGLCASTRLGGLRRLDVGSNPLDVASHLALTNPQALPGLERLVIWPNPQFPEVASAERIQALFAVRRPGLVVEPKPHQRSKNVITRSST